MIVGNSLAPLLAAMNRPKHEGAVAKQASR